MKKDYNVIWIDDEWEKQLEFKDECEELGIHLCPFSYQKAGMDELDKHLNSWDAIILDGEINDKSDHEEPSTEGLLNALMHLAGLPANKQIPYFISTGKDKVKNNEMLKGKTIYLKDVDDEKLIDDICKKIDDTERFKVKVLYKDIIDFLWRVNKDICDSIICIFQKMHYPDSNDSFDSKLYYNQIRQGLECVFIEANKKGIIPDECFSGDRPNIDQCYRYLVGNPAIHAGVRYGQPGERIAPEYIGDMMSLIKNIGNEFSHPNENSKTHYLLFSLAFNLYEIVVWMFQYFEEHPDKNENMKKCVKIEKIKDNELEGIVEVQKIYHIGRNFTINPVFVLNNRLIGKRVKIEKWNVNKDDNLKKLYPYFASSVNPIEDA